MGETWVSRPIVDVKRDYTVCITNPNEDGLPIAVNIPAEMILMADMVLREAWVPIWILSAIKIGGWKCPTCGSKC